MDTEKLLDYTAENESPNSNDDEVTPKQTVPRLLIRVLTIFPKELISEISERSELIRKTAKVPMLALLSCTGYLGGYSTTLFKFFGEVVVEGKTISVALLSFSLLGVALFTNLLMLIFLNISMKYYD